MNVRLVSGWSNCGETRTLAPVGFPFFGVSLFFFLHAVWSVRLFSLSRGVSLHPVMPARIMVAVATCLACASSNKVFMEMTKLASNGRVTMEHRARAFSRSLSLLPSLFLSFTHLVFLSQSPHSADSGDGREKVWRERDEGKEWWVVRPCHRQLMARALKSQFVWMKSSKLGRVFVNRLEQRYNTSEDCSHAYFMIICWKCHKHFLSPSHLNAKSHCVLIKWWSSLYKTKLE